MANFASRFMDTIGDGTGSTNMNVDGSVTPVIFRIKPAPGEILYVSRILFTLEDNGSIDSGGFGNGSALTNGLIFRFQYDVGEPTEGTYPQPTFVPIVKNGEWHYYCGVDVQVSTWGSGNQFLAARYSFFKDVNNNNSAVPWVADGRKEEFQLVVQDDCSGIVNMKCRCGMWSTN